MLDELRSTNAPNMGMLCALQYHGDLFSELLLRDAVSSSSLTHSERQVCLLILNPRLAECPEDHGPTGTIIQPIMVYLGASPRDRPASLLLTRVIFSASLILALSTKPTPFSETLLGCEDIFAWEGPPFFSPGQWRSMEKPIGFEGRHLDCGFADHDIDPLVAPAAPRMSAAGSRLLSACTYACLGAGMASHPWCFSQSDDDVTRTIRPRAKNGMGRLTYCLCHLRTDVGHLELLTAASPRQLGGRVCRALGMARERINAAWSDQWRWPDRQMIEVINELFEVCWEESE
eukprot:gnl/Dysnectes_brevis/8495_a15118_143.p1 GENE.gnl/Dysnectes_brevis/8495_a15118_143~~gnl/Dysnectes_brevis/8495_a15118_143.p1  ORF type:complete len:328 (-),score=45.11 gnl/Dysnectes_brevis/8495_a15118_143:89-955(-)